MNTKFLVAGLPGLAKRFVIAAAWVFAAGLTKAAPSKALTWERQAHPGLANPHALSVGDFDGDGDVDVAVASYTAFVVRWYENDGKGFFTTHDIDTGNLQQAYDMKTADVDGDGRPDLILAGRESRNVVLYLNRK